MHAELLAAEHAERPLLAAVNAEADFAVRALLKDVLLSLAKLAARTPDTAEPWVDLLAAVVQGGSCWESSGRGGGFATLGMDGGGGSMAREGLDGLAMAEEGRLEEEAEGAAGWSGALDVGLGDGGLSAAIGSPRISLVRRGMAACMGLLHVSATRNYPWGPPRGCALSCACVGDHW